MRTTLFVTAICAVIGLAADANADDWSSTRDVEAAVDSYLASAGDDASLVGGAGSAGYDAGFWIRGGDFMLRINATLQARFESWNWDDEDGPVDDGDRPGGGEGDQPIVWAGDLSGFSLPRATLKLSGEAPCNICYYVELEFGHWGRWATDYRADAETVEDDPLGGGDNDDEDHQSMNFDNTREAWIEWCYCPSFNIRMGQVLLPGTRQSMVAPELQQFIDISLATAFVQKTMPGLTDRNRDHGLLIHGLFGCNNEWSYMASITNGDGGDSIRNVLDHRTSDNLAYGARINWAFLAPIGYEEGALRQQTCQWYGELGAWGWFYADREDKPHVKDAGDHLHYGIDLALGYGGWSFTGAFSAATLSDAENNDDYSDIAYLVQLGYHFPGTAWEIAARFSGYRRDDDAEDDEDGALEYAFGINYYLNGHGNKLGLDIAFIETDDHNGINDFYAGYQAGIDDLDDNGDSAILLRFQWQLAL